jgi:hypothetical protein
MGRVAIQLVAISVLVSAVPAWAQQSIDRFWERPPEMKVGLFDGDEAYVFGEIRDVIALQRGGFVVLDGLFYELRWFDDRGRWVATAGRKGQGPGEFESPNVAEVDETGRVWVIDRRNIRLSAFRAAGEHLEFVAEISLSGPVHYARDLCWMHEALILHAVASEGVLHVVDESGVRRSFGRALEAEIAPKLRRHEVLLQTRFNSGRVACVEGFGVVLLHDEQPILRAVSPTGEELWRRTLEDYRQLAHEPTDRGGLRYAADPETGTAHHGSGLVVRGDLVYAALSESGMYGSTYELRIYRLEDGSLVSRAEVPFVLSAMGREYAYGVVEDPIPQVWVFRRGSPAP